MKKIYLTLGLGALLLGANAQEFKKSLTAGQSITPNLNWTGANLVSTPTASSILFPASFQSGGCAVTGTNAGLAYIESTTYSATPQYTYDARGFDFGTNVTYYNNGSTTYTLNTTTAAQKYNVTGTGITVTNILVLAGKATSNASTSLVKAKIYSENATTKGPDTQIGTTATKALNTFTTGTTYNVLTFGTPVSISAGNFFAAIESPSIGGATKDTLAILSTRFECSSTDSLSWINTKTFGGGVSDSSWASVNDTYGDNLDLAIFPVMNIASGLNTISKGELTLLAAFPNPATNEVSINFSLNQSSKVEIEIYDVTGKLVGVTKLDNLEVGNHTSKLDISNLGSGVYMYGVKTENAKIFSKFTIAQ